MMGHLCGFTGHNLRHTFATIVTEESGDLTVAMQLIRDKVPGVALWYVERDLPTLLERYSPVRQLERKPSLWRGRVWRRRERALNSLLIRRGGSTP